MKNGGSLVGEIEFIPTLSSSRPVVLLTHARTFVLGLGFPYLGVEASSAEQVTTRLSLHFAYDEQHND
jgi:hypothetical protein